MKVEVCFLKHFSHSNCFWIFGLYMSVLCAILDRAVIDHD